MLKAVRLSVLVLTGLLLTVGSAPAKRAGLHVTFAPQHVLQGKDARVAVGVAPAGSACTLRVRYHDGSLQPGLRRIVAFQGRAAWSWTVPTSVQAGVAVATVHCNRAGTLSRKLVVVGRLLAPRIVVRQSGFSTRTNAGGGTRLSYGLILHNQSPDHDATRVVVQTNFVLADDNLLGTNTSHVDDIPANGDYALGATVSFAGAAPIARLEVVIQVGGFTAQRLLLPTLANIHLVPESFDPSWLGSVEGEVQNTQPTQVLRSATLSAVVFDSAGQIIGGGSGFAFQPLPPGAREFLKLASGFDVMSMERAASVVVSISPTWQDPGS